MTLGISDGNNLWETSDTVVTERDLAFGQVSKIKTG